LRQRFLSTCHLLAMARQPAFQPAFQRFNLPAECAAFSSDDFAPVKSRAPTSRVASEGASTCSGGNGSVCSQDTLPEYPGSCDSINASDTRLYSKSVPVDLLPKPHVSDVTEVQPWCPERFRCATKLQDAVRNRGQVLQMYDTLLGASVAVKIMPSDWVCASPEAFLNRHPKEIEQPWMDIKCTSYLNQIGYPWACRLHGVYEDRQYTTVVTELASEGDLLGWCSRPYIPAPGAARESFLKPFVKQLVQAVSQLHELSIVHRDLSLENVLLTQDMQIKLIDFGMATMGRSVCLANCGKRSYQAPEAHAHTLCDGFLSDAFAVGVIVYTMLVEDYPWDSTRPNACKCFEHVREVGLRAHLKMRRLGQRKSSVFKCLSEEAVQLLEGLLAIDPAQRLSLGESDLTQSGHRSVWDEAWFCV